MLACLLLCACRIEKNRSAVPAQTSWIVDDDARTPAGAPIFSLSRDGAFTVQPGVSDARPRIALSCIANNPVVVRLLLPPAFVPLTQGDSAPVLVRWHTDEGSATHTQQWLVLRSDGDSVVAVQSLPGFVRQLRPARTLTFAFVHPPRPEEISFELGGLSDYLAQAAATCRLDPATLDSR